MSGFPPPPPTIITPTKANSWTGARWGALVGSAGLIVGSLLPWITVKTFIGSVNFAGTEGDGKLTLIAGLIAGVCVLIGTETFLVSAIAGLAGLAVAGYQYMNISDKADELSTEYATASAGVGLYVCLAGAVAAIICSFIARSNVG